MEELLDTLINYLLPQSNIVLYLFLFLSAVIENLFPPVPGDTITALGAFLVGTGRLDYILVYLSTSMGSVVGFMCLYFLGRILEREFFMKHDYRAFPRESIVSAERWFSRYGYLIVLANRFFPGIRSVISIVSGISRLKVINVLLLSIVSASVWNLIWIQAGYMLGNNWHTVRQQVSRMLKSYNTAAGVFLAVCAVAVFVYFIIKKKKNRNIT